MVPAKIQTELELAQASIMDVVVRKLTHPEYRIWFCVADEYGADYADLRIHL
jgi:hypothetical protein